MPEKIEAYKLILSDIISFDSPVKVCFSILAMVTLMVYCFSANILWLIILISVLVNVIMEGKISRFVALIIVRMLRVQGILIPKELEDVIK